MNLPGKPSLNVRFVFHIYLVRLAHDHHDHHDVVVNLPNDQNWHIFLRVGSDRVCTQGVTIGRSQAVQGRLAKAVLCIKPAQPLESSVAKKQSLDQHEGAF